ncbi:NAD(P)/FAD-dependent oxidoreductase [Actinophytocola algeriensis]|uniref:3-phenylpropionate/trans-cinnamate dioxygenase ferredoxin reductase subunit n=1 Tax=Actinophytocola algeriensis TaxID=1768010 RepID=A0A7W7VCP9_9PSEU|nr:FAD-dependent oxidoreductase [Actinophytocola algeriensis]MBB4905356.1 3-phenylpropionate/trans-cinnamate dioxygenase ferredoxin reductase subunit [Actinophytocola algeriensis]MBE1472959.1 3-phenylpropionate/trans-cinnamate dioxygenase ferredoxin reductase subunit [Actinophytocola algeriensis]
MRCVLVGGGVAAAATAAALRRRGYDGEIVLVADEPDAPYERPPLSKDVLAGGDVVPARKPEWYRDNGVGLRLGTRATSIDTTTRTVRLTDGDDLRYDTLVLATGMRARRLAGFDGARIHYLRTAADARALRADLVAAERVVVLGAGFVGCEVAASSVGLGKQVTIFEPEPTPLARVLGVKIGAAVLDIHRARGVEVRTGEYVETCTPSGGRLVLESNLGHRVDADLVVVGVGALPNDDLARHAGIETGNGIHVDEYGRTSAPGVWALGDVAAQLHHGRRVRVEHHDNALRQGQTVAANITGEQKPHTDPHWFWSDHYEHKLQSVGHARDLDDLVLRGSVEEGVFSAFSLTDGRLDGVISLGRPGDVLAVRRALLAPHTVTADELRDESLPLKQLLSR